MRSTIVSGPIFPFSPPLPADNFIIRCAGLGGVVWGVGALRWALNEREARVKRRGVAPSARFWFSEFSGRRKGLEPPPVSPPKAELRGES